MPPAQQRRGGKGLSKQMGGQPVWAWAAEVGGALVVFLWWRNRQNAAAAAAANAPTAGLPSAATQAGTNTGVTTGQGTSSYPSITAWLDAALGGATNSKYSSTQAYNDFTNWMNGNCVTSEGATAIGNALQTLGLPPTGQLGTVSVCASATPPGSTASQGYPTPSSGVPSGFTYVPTPQIGVSLIQKGYYLVGFGNQLFYNTNQKVLSPGYKRTTNLEWVSTPALVSELRSAGYQLYQMGTSYYYDPGMPAAKAPLTPIKVS